MGPHFIYLVDADNLKAERPRIKVIIKFYSAKVHVVNITIHFFEGISKASKLKQIY